MKNENAARIYRFSYFGDNYFYTILMDYNPWKLYYCEGFPCGAGLEEPQSLKEINSAEILEFHKSIPDVSSWLIDFFQRQNIFKWRKAKNVIPEDHMTMILDGSSIGLIYKKGKRLRNIVYEENVYPESISFPEFDALIELIDHLDTIRIEQCGGEPSMAGAYFQSEE